MIPVSDYHVAPVSDCHVTSVSDYHVASVSDYHVTSVFVCILHPFVMRKMNSIQKSYEEGPLLIPRANAHHASNAHAKIGEET